MLGWGYFRFNQSTHEFCKVLEFYNFGREEFLYYMTTPCFLAKQKNSLECSQDLLLGNENTGDFFLSQFSSVQWLSHVQLFATPQTAACQASLSITNSRSLLELMSIESVMPSNHLILCHPLLLLPSIFPSIRVFSTESVCRISWPKYWSFSISPSSEHPGLISFRMDWLDLHADHWGHSYFSLWLLRGKLQSSSPSISIFSPD